MANEAGGDVFLLLPQVLLEGGASTDGFGVGGLGLPIVERLLEQGRAELRGELFRTILPMGGRPPLHGMISEQVSEESSPFLVDLGLVVRDTEPFFVGVGRFTTFTFFFQPRRNSLAYQYHLFSFSRHLNMADLLCFLTYATMDLVGSNSQGESSVATSLPLW